MELERMWKEAVLANFRYSLGVCSEGLKETKRNVRQDGQPPGRNLNLRQERQTLECAVG
jgi:hypothetical protein